MISPLQNLQTLVAVEQQLLANILQNLGPMPGQQQTAGQTGTADIPNFPQTPRLPCPSPSRGEGLRERVIPKGSEGEVKETSDFQPITQKDQAVLLKEQIVSLLQTMVQQGYLPPSTLNQPSLVIVPQMLACLGRLHREEKKKKQKKKKKADNSSEKDESPIYSLIRQVFKLKAHLPI